MHAVWSKIRSSVVGMSYELKVLLCILLIGVGLRSIGFPQVPVSLYWDEMAIWNDAQSILHTGRDLHNRFWLQPLFISYGDYKLPVYIWLVALFSGLGFDMFAATRLPSFLAGVSMIGAVWLLVLAWVQKYKEAEGTNSRWWPLFAAGVLAVLPWSLHFSHVGFEGHVSSALLLWSLVLAFWGMESTYPKTRWAYVVLGSLLGSLAVYTYFSTRFVWPVLFALIPVLWAGRALSKWIPFFVGGFLWVLLLVPMYRADFYQASNQFRLSTTNILNDPDRPVEINVWRERSGNTFLSKVQANTYTFILRDLAVNYAAHFDTNYLIWHGEKNMRHASGVYGILFPALFPFLVFGIFALYKKSWKFGFFVTVWWLLSLLPASVPTDVPHALRSLNALPAVVVFISFGLFSVWNWCLSQRFFKLSAPLFFGVVLSFSLFTWIYNWTQIYPKTSAHEWQDGYLQLAQYIAEHKDEHVAFYVHSFDERFFLYYQPYSGKTWKEIQEMPSQNFARNTFDNVMIKTIDDWHFLIHDSAVATRPGMAPADWPVLDTIYGSNGEEEFVVVAVQRE